jgi:hypothetical protein
VPLREIEYNLYIRDANKDGKYEELYAFGGRSFTIWNGDRKFSFDSVI